MDSTVQGQIIPPGPEEGVYDPLRELVRVLAVNEEVVEAAKSVASRIGCCYSVLEISLTLVAKKI